MRGGMLLRVQCVNLNQQNAMFYKGHAKQKCHMLTKRKSHYQPCAKAVQCTIHHTNESPMNTKKERWW